MKLNELDKLIEKRMKLEKKSHVRRVIVIKPEMIDFASDVLGINKEDFLKGKHQKINGINIFTEG